MCLEVLGILFGVMLKMVWILQCLVPILTYWCP